MARENPWLALPETVRLVAPPPGSRAWPYWLCEETGDTADLQPLPYPRPPFSPEQKAVLEFFGGSRLKLTPYQEENVYFDIRDPKTREASELRARLFWRRHAGAVVELTSEEDTP